MRKSQLKAGAEHMPEYERALRQLSVQDLLNCLAAHADGVAARDLLAELVSQGIEPRAARLLIQSQIDSGRIRLGERMKLVLAGQPVAA